MDACVVYAAGETIVKHSSSFGHRPYYEDPHTETDGTGVLVVSRVHVTDHPGPPKHTPAHYSSASVLPL